MISAIVHGFSGFWLQLLPCAFFCLYPFADSFRYPRKRLIALLLLILSVMSAVFTWFYVKLDIVSDEDASYLPLNLIFVLTLVLLLAVYLLCIRAETVHKVFVFILIANYGFLMTELVSNTPSFSEPEYMYCTSALLFHLLFNGLMLCPMLYILRHVRSAFHERIDPAIWKGISVIPGIFFAGLLLFYEIPVSAGIPDRQVLNLLTGAMEVLMLFLCYVVLRLLETTRRHSGEYAALEASLESYRLLADAQGQIREAHHEIRHHIAALSILLQNRDYDGAARYLDSVSQDDAKVETASYTPHLLLNSMLANYRAKAGAAGIEVSYTVRVPGPVFMEDMDLCQFLSNLLDNALEANSHLAPGERRLSLTVRQTEDFLYFRCENPFDPALLRPAGSGFFTSKSDRTAHGYGISIMERIAKKYNGVFRTEIQNDIFIAAANLCGSTKEKRMN